MAISCGKGKLARLDINLTRQLARHCIPALHQESLCNYKSQRNGTTSLMSPSKVDQLFVLDLADLKEIICVWGLVCSTHLPPPASSPQWNSQETLDNPTSYGFSFTAHPLHFPHPPGSASWYQETWLLGPKNTSSGHQTRRARETLLG